MKGHNPNLSFIFNLQIPKIFVEDIQNQKEDLKILNFSY
jgi:hypothetical protein